MSVKESTLEGSLRWHIQMISLKQSAITAMQSTPNNSGKFVFQLCGSFSWIIHVTVPITKDSLKTANRINQRTGQPFFPSFNRLRVRPSDTQNIFIAYTHTAFANTFENLWVYSDGMSCLKILFFNYYYSDKTTFLWCSGDQCNTFRFKVPAKASYGESLRPSRTMIS